MRVRCLVALSIIGVILLSASSVFAEIPQLISYQGKLTDSGGAPVADGDYAMTFTIYDAASGGSSLWSSGAVTVAVSGGVFSVVLGESPQPAISLAFDADYWVETSIEGDIQSPRTRLGSVGYAYMASGIVPGTEMIDTRSNPIFKGTNLGTGAGLRGDSDSGIGVRGESAATDGKGVYGVANAATGSNYGVYGTSSSTSGSGVCGISTATTGSTYGGRFENSSTTYGRGVFAWAKGTTGQAVGVYGVSSSPSGYAVLGEADATTGTNYGVYGKTNSTDGYGGYFDGRGYFSGNVGIGTDTPDRELSVVGYVRAARDTAETNYTEIYHGGSNALINWSGAGDLDFRYSNSTKMTIQQDGDVGIGTASPGALLDVRGDAVFNEGGGDYDFRVEGDTRPNLVFVDASTDRVGIGTASPDAVLDVQGDTGFYTVKGQTATTWGYAICGEATYTGSDYTCGVVGFNHSKFGAGVLGESFADSGETFGGLFVNFSRGGRGVWGYAESTTGATVGVFGECDSPGGRGVVGVANSAGGTPCGVRGKVISTSGYGVYYEGGLAGSGPKACVVKTSQGPTLMYCQESPENWFEDFGEGRLVGGRCHIELDPLFLETVTIDDANPVKVFVEHRGPCQGTYIETGETGFDVIEQNTGTSDVGFCYRVVAKRKGFESKRLDYCEAAETDSYLFPELRERELREREEKQARMEKEWRPRMTSANE